jgi:hypothetical protein
MLVSVYQLLPLEVMAHYEVSDLVRDREASAHGRIVTLHRNARTATAGDEQARDIVSQILQDDPKVQGRRDLLHVHGRILDAQPVDQLFSGGSRQLNVAHACSLRFGSARTGSS